ncbi:MAG TPA: YajQ family cyclic di-GMP-binding protein [Thioploca sp.]|nr:YajQ family cyclic di-GMP-binding protein [Thioploca sp.]
MPSFDIVSEVDLHELSNTVDQTNREIMNRFDFKGSKAHIEYNQDTLTLHAENEFQLKQMTDILYKKSAKRGIDIAAFTVGEPEIQNHQARLQVTVKQGIDKENAKIIVKMIKASKIKVQASIQSEQIRVTGKKRDDLQQIMTLLRKEDMDLPLQFNNFRD